MAAVVFGLVVPASAASAQPLVTANDFVPQLTGGSATIERPDKVKVEDQVVEAASAQDAINAAVDRNKKGLTSRSKREDGRRYHVQLIKFPSGIGLVSAGMGEYGNAGDLVTARISQRNAYVVAYMQAKRGLATFLRGLSHESEELLAQNAASFSDAARHLNNLDSSTRLSIKELGEHLLRGFVVYEVDDDTRNKTVYVSLVSTPKTRGKLVRSSPVSIEAASVHEGLDQLLAEIRAGIVFPLGGRVITVPRTGETAVVGYGSFVVRMDANETLAARLRLDARKTASMLAQDSLCGMLRGDTMTWEDKLDDRTARLFAGFEAPAKDDPLASTNPEDIKQLEKSRDMIISRVQFATNSRSVRKGLIPPGVVVRTWFSDDDSWAYGVAVYVPSVSNLVTQVRREMDETEFIPPSNVSNPAPVNGKEGSSPAPIPRGPSGKLDDKDL
jgi:hypothetical protein